VGLARRALLLWLGLALGAGAAPPEPTLRFDLPNADLPRVIEEIARATGTRIVHDPDLRGRLTLALTTPVTRDEALEILHAALLALGFAMLPGPDGLFRVLPVTDARSIAPLRAVEELSESDRLVATLVRLESADANEVARAVDPRSPFGTMVQPWPRSNSLILASSESRVRRMLQLVRALDRAAKSELRVVPLRWARAVRAAEQLDAAFPTDGPSGPRQKIVADERTNALVLEAPPERLRAMQRFLATLDTPAPGRGRVHVVHVKNADAEALAQRIQEIAGDERSALPADAFQLVADPPTNRLVVVSDPDVFGPIAETIAELDRVPRHVAIDVALIEIDHSRDLALGLDALFPLMELPDEVGDPIWLGAIGDPLGAAVSDPGALPFVARLTRDPIAIPFVGPDGIPTTVVIPATAVQITAAEGNARVTLLQRPHLLASTGEEQRIFAGEQVPIPASTTAAAPGQTQTAAGFVTRSAIERTDVGVDVRVTPIALSERVVELEIEIRLSSVSATAAATSAELGPTLAKAEVQGRIRLWDGAVALLAASPRDDLERSVAGVPFLRDIPILGWAFKTVRDRRLVRRVVFAVQATVLESPGALAAEGIRRRLAFEREQARTRPLAALSDAPYALLVATFPSRADAERTAATLAGLGGTPHVVAWEDGGQPVFDVYLADLREIAAAGPLAFALRERGFRPALAVLPERVVR
jgi:general secretion pathway protein D